MTLIRLRGLRDAIPAPELTRVTATVQRWAGHAPAAVFDGADLILPTGVQIDVNAETINLPPTDGRYCIRWTITAPIPGVAPIVRHTSVPAAASVDFDDLADVDPYTFQPTVDVVAAWEGVLASVRAVAAAVDDHAADAGRSAFSAGKSASIALGHANDAEAAALATAQDVQDAAAHARDADDARAAAFEARTDAGSAADDAELARDDARTARGEAQTARGGAELARDDARTARGEAQTARGGAELARDASQLAKADAEKARDLALAGQFAGTRVSSAGLDLNGMRTPGIYRFVGGAENTSTNLPRTSTAGVLEVIAVGDNNQVVQQRYTVIAPAPYGYFLRRVNSDGSVTAWRFTATQRVDQSAGRAIYTWDEVNNREQLIYGDTGFRDLTALVQNGWTVAILRIRRVGSVVTLGIYALNPAAATSDVFAAIPFGFQPTYGGNIHHHVRSSNGAMTYAVCAASGGALSIPRNAGVLANGSIATWTWLTDQTWPVPPLPGTPSGGIANV